MVKGAAKPIKERLDRGRALAAKTQAVSGKKKLLQVRDLKPGEKKVTIFGFLNSKTLRCERGEGGPQRSAVQPDKNSPSSCSCQPHSWPGSHECERSGALEDRAWEEMGTRPVPTRSQLPLTTG